MWKLYPNHSTRTTVLLDDSVDKAQLQSDNHICVSKYTADSHSNHLKALKRDDPNSMDLDEMLIAVVGILEELREKDDLSGWIRGGGIRQLSLERIVGEGSDISQTIEDLESRFATLATSDEAPIWFNDAYVLKHWIKKGRETLESLRIPINNGVVSN